MRYLKFLGLAGMIVAALMGFAGSAAATSVTTTTGGAAETPTIHAVNEGGHVTFSNPIANISCSSTFEGIVEAHGSGVSASGDISSFEFTGCTNSWHVTRKFRPRFTKSWTGGHNGTVFLDLWRFQFTRLGIICTYEANGIKMGEVTGGNPATIKLTASIPIVISESSGLCGTSNTKWEGSYVTTSALYVAP